MAFTTAVVLLYFCSFSWRSGDCRAVNCLHSRLDILSCVPHKDTSWPGPNEYALYRTFIRSRVPECRHRDPNANSNFQIIRPIDDLGNPNMRLLHSPGYLLNQRYANQMLVHYNVQCPEGRLPFLVYNDFRLQDKECFARCEDYVNISCATCGTSESCGREPTNNLYSLEQERFSVLFRTSRRKNDMGFELGVICFEPSSEGGSNSSGLKKRDLEIQAVAMSADEEEVCKNLTNELFSVIPSANDFNITDIAEELQEEELPLLNRRRSTAISHHLVSTSAIRLALLCENSTNPVVSTIAASTVSIATHQSPSRVESVRGSLT